MATLSPSAAADDAPVPAPVATITVIEAAPISAEPATFQAVTTTPDATATIELTDELAPAAATVFPGVDPLRIAAKCAEAYTMRHTVIDHGHWEAADCREQATGVINHGLAYWLDHRGSAGPPSIYGFANDWTRIFQMPAGTEVALVQAWYYSYFAIGGLGISQCWFVDRTDTMWLFSPWQGYVPGNFRPQTGVEALPRYGEDARRMTIYLVPPCG